VSESFPIAFGLALVPALLGVCLLWKRPVTDSGKLALKLFLTNGVGWFAILPLSRTGDPPPILIAGVLFWLINLPLLAAAATALWVSHKDHNEHIAYLAIASTYLTLNVAILFVMPVIGLLLGSV